MKILNAVLAYKDFEWNDLDENSLNKFLVFTSNDIKTNLPYIQKININPEYDNRVYGEYTYLLFINENIDFDWIVINQYRRRFILPDYNNIYVTNPLKFNATVEDMFCIYHNKKDLDLITDIIMNENLEDEFKLEWLLSLKDHYMICHNMISCPKSILNDYIKLYLRITNIFKTIRHFYSYDEVLQYYKQNNKSEKHTPEHQSRIFAFIGERLFNCYFRLYAKKHNNLPFINNPLYTCDYKKMEEGMDI